MNALDRALRDRTFIEFCARTPGALQRFLVIVHKYQGHIPDYLMDHMRESRDFGEVTLPDPEYKRMLDADLDMYFALGELESLSVDSMEA